MFSKIKKVMEGVINPISSTDQKPQHKEDLIKFVNDEFSKRQTARLPFELQWRLNIDFLDGNQYSYIDMERAVIDQKPKMNWWEVRRVYNHIAPIIETRLAKLSRASKSLKVRPATSEREDISSAKVSTKLLESTAKEQGMKELQQVANGWSEITGTAIFKTTWSKQKGRLLGEINVAVEGEEQQEQQQESKKFYEGGLETDVCSPFEIYPDSCFNNEKKVRSMIHARAYHIDEVKSIWGVDVKGEKINTFSLKSTSGTGGLGVKGQRHSISTATQENSVVVTEYWELPSSKYPKGRLIICTQNELLYTGDLPFQDEEGNYFLPFKVQQSIQQIGQYFGKSVIERLIDVQTQYNALKNRKTEYLNRACIGQMSYEEGTIDEEYLEDGFAPAQMLPRKRGSQPPVYLSFPPLPNAFESEEQSLLHLFVTISGVSEVSRDSQSPVGVNSGVALSILKEQDDTRLSYTIENIENATIGLGKMWLRMYKQYVEVPRILKNVGDNNITEVLEWDGNDITSFDIYIESSASLSETPMQRRQYVMDLFQMGLFNDPETGRITKEGRIKLFDMLQLGNWEQYDDDDNLHIQKALRENREIMQGGMPQAREFDDHMAHIQKHNTFRLTSDYEEQLAENPQLDQMFEAHLMQHFEILQSQAPEPQPEILEKEQIGG